MKKQIPLFVMSTLSLFGFITLYIGTHIYLIDLLTITSLNLFLLQSIVLFLGVSPILASFISRRGLGSIHFQVFFTRLGYLWLGILLLLLMVILGVGLLNGMLQLFGWNPFPPQIVYSTILIITASITLYGLYSAYRSPQVITYTVDRRQQYGQNKLLKIVQLSDLHLGYGLGHRFLNNVIKKTNDLNPDLIVITGDIMESSPDYFKQFRQDFKKFKATYGTYAVTGNHDFYNGVGPFMKIMKESNIPVLENELIRLDNEVQLIGIHDPTANQSNRPEIESNMEKALATKTEDSPSILLAHQPKNYQLAIENKVDLILCGHTHKGQIFPFNLLVKRVFDFVSGHHQLSSSTDLIISQGTGFWGPPLRVGANSEIVQIELLY